MNDNLTDMFSAGFLFISDPSLCISDGFLSSLLLTELSYSWAASESGSLTFVSVT